MTRRTLKHSEKGFALIFAVIILGIVGSYVMYLPLAGRYASVLSKDYFYGSRARYLAESGIDGTIARIRRDVTRMPLVQLRVDGNGNGSWAEDVDELTPRGVLDQNYSTRRDGLDQDGDGQIDEADETQNIGGAQEGFFTVVRDLGRGIDLNLSSPDVALNSTRANNALRYALARFPEINEINIGADSLVSGGIVDAIISYRNNELGGRFHSIEELKAVPGMTNAIYNRLKDFVTVTTPDTVVGGGLIAHYYNNITGTPSNAQFDYNSYAGSVIEKGAGGFKRGGSFAFYMYNATDFEGTQVTPASFTAASVNPRPITLTRQGVLTNDASPGNPVVTTTQLTFGVRWEGFIFVPEDRFTSGQGAPMTFRVIATGGARMKIGGQALVRTNDFWNSAHNGAPGYSSTDYFQFSTSLNDFSSGWQPIEIEYWCNNSIPVFILLWNEGFRLRPGSANDHTDPDVDMGEQTQSIASAQLGYKAGSFYEIRSTGIVRNNVGGIESQKTLTGRFRLYDFFHDTLVRDFSQGSFSAGQISLRDSYPVGPSNADNNVNEEFSRTSPYRRNYHTIHNAVKIGYWANFDDLADDFSSSTGFGGWKARNAETTLALSDIDGDGDRELAITSTDDMTTDPYIPFFDASAFLSIPAADLVGTGSAASPDSAYNYRYFYWRFREHANRGPMDRIAGLAGGIDPSDGSWKNSVEDYADPAVFPGTDTTNFSADYPGSESPDGPLTTTCVDTTLRAEDKNCTGTVASSANNDGPHSYWVGQPFFRRTDGTGADRPFYTEQFGPGPNGTSNKPNYKRHVQFRFLNGRGHVNFNPGGPGLGYNTAGYEWLAVNSRPSFSALDYMFWFQLPGGSTGGMAYLGLCDNALNNNVTLGYRSLGNEAAYPRAIDSIRIFPAIPDQSGAQTTPFTSRNLDAGENVTWGVISWSKLPSGTWTDSGGNSVSGYQFSGVDLSFGTGAGANPSAATSLTASNARGGRALLGSSFDATRYARYRADFYVNTYNSINVNMDPPLLEEVTVTYMRPVDRVYMREAVEGD